MSWSSQKHFAGHNAPHNEMCYSASVFLLLFASRRTLFRLGRVKPASLKREAELKIGAKIDNRSLFKGTQPLGALEPLGSVCRAVTKLSAYVLLGTRVGSIEKKLEGQWGLWPQSHMRNHWKKLESLDKNRLKGRHTHTPACLELRIPARASQAVESLSITPPHTAPAAGSVRDTDHLPSSHLVSHRKEVETVEQ